MKWYEHLFGFMAGLLSRRDLERAGAGPGIGFTMNMALGSGYDAGSDEAHARAAIVAYMRSNLGDKYLLGIEVKPGEDSDTWDCSEITEAAYRGAGLNLPDGSPMQYDFCQQIRKPQPGDLHFLYSDKWGRIGHVMVDTGEGTVIHAVGGRGVVEDPAEKWTSHPRYRGCRRHPDFKRPPEDRA